MPGRKHSKLSLGLPVNLRAKLVRGKIYYIYRNPESGEETGQGYDKGVAIEAAHELNSYLSKSANNVARTLAKQQKAAQVAEASKNAITFGAYVEKFLTKILPTLRQKSTHKPLAERTVGEYHRILNNIKAEFGDRVFIEITQEEWADYLGELSSAEVHTKYRQKLVKVYKHARSDGILTRRINGIDITMENLPEIILPMDKGEVLRQRLTLEDYRKIYAHAEHHSPAIANAMALELHTLQRRSDIRQMKFGDVEDGYLKVIQEKTGKPLKIAVSEELWGVITKCEADRVGGGGKVAKIGKRSPYLVQREPDRRQKSKEKADFYQLSGREISVGFSEMRDAAGACQKLEKAARPTFHEIRALGADLYLRAGWPLERIQKLLGHSSLAMTKLYLSRHQIHWEEIDEAGHKNLSDQTQS